MSEWISVEDELPPDSDNSFFVVAEYGNRFEYNVCYVNDGVFISEETDHVIPVIKWQLITETQHNRG
jgi:hypothetical protein